jgi:hypothetical protein
MVVVLVNEYKKFLHFVLLQLIGFCLLSNETYTLLVHLERLWKPGKSLLFSPNYDKIKNNFQKLYYGGD